MARPRPFQSLFRLMYKALDVEKEIFLMPILAHDDQMHAALDCSAHTGSHALTVSPDYPRNLTILTSDNAGDNLAGTVTVTGTDVRGDAQTEVFTIVAGTDTVEGNKAFATLTNVAWNLPTSATSDTLAIGVGNKLGLSKPAASVVKETFNGADRAVGTLNTTYNTYVTGGTLDGAKAVEVIYRVKY